MQITYLHIMNYKSISDLELKDIEDVLILVGRNSTGKSVVLDAIRVVSGDCSVSEDDFNDSEGNISIKVHLMIDDNDLKLLFERGVVSSFKHYNLWLKDFNSKLHIITISLNSNTYIQEMEKSNIKTDLRRIIHLSRQFFLRYIMWTILEENQPFRMILLCFRAEVNIQT